MDANKRTGEHFIPVRRHLCAGYPLVRKPERLYSPRSRRWNLTVTTDPTKISGGQRILLVVKREFELPFEQMQDDIRSRMLVSREPLIGSKLEPNRPWFASLAHFRVWRFLQIIDSGDGDPRCLGVSPFGRNSPDLFPGHGRVGS